jgi:hypothetical protein
MALKRINKELADLGRYVTNSYNPYALPNWSGDASRDVRQVGLRISGGSL